jgi:hypothetical protein
MVEVFMITEFKNDSCFTHIMKCEDHFMSHWVFVAGFGKTPRQSSMMAYGTILDYAKFDEAWEKIHDKYSVDCWREMCQYWIYQSYLSPIPVLLVSQIYRKLGLKYEIKDGTLKEVENG